MNLLWCFSSDFPPSLHSILPSLSALDISFDVTQCIFDCLMSSLEMLVDSLNGLNCVSASKQTNTFKVVNFLQFFKTLQVQILQNFTLCFNIILWEQLDCRVHLPENRQVIFKKSYKEYSVSDISRSVYVAIMWKCLSRWFICIVIIISLRSPQLICDGLEPLTSRPTALGRVFPTFACGPKGQYVS